MEKYLITDLEKEEYLEKFPVLKCENSIGIDYEGYVSIKCKALTGSCTYRNSNEKEYKNCKLLQNS